jgi:hypothetical protein
VTLKIEGISVTKDELLKFVNQYIHNIDSGLKCDAIGVMKSV